MVPVLFGRLQTRAFVLATVGVLWTVLITPFLPPHSVALATRYRATFTVLATVLVVGLVWECLYHLLQQFRWEKDWPAFFGLLTSINEGVVAWWVVRNVTYERIDGAAFVIHFATVWLVTWMFLNGPMRVIDLRWRFRGGRLI